MKYEGTLYGKVAGRYIPMTETVLELETKVKNLLKYARHLDGCQIISTSSLFPDETRSCTCGLKDFK